MKTELIICPEYQAADKGCEIISKRPDGFDNFAYKIKNQEKTVSMCFFARVKSLINRRTGL